jgi:hypothetical protein
MSKYLGDIIVPATKADGSMATYFQDKKVSELLTAAKAKLDAADTVQEVTVASLPKETRKVYETKGRLLELIEDLNRVARTSFGGDSAKIGLFNKDILLRGARPRQRRTSRSRRWSREGRPIGTRALAHPLTNSESRPRASTQNTRRRRVAQSTYVPAAATLPR